MKHGKYLTSKRRTTVKEITPQYDPKSFFIRWIMLFIKPLLYSFTDSHFISNWERLESPRNDQLDSEKLNSLKLKVRGCLQELEDSDNFMKKLLRINQSKFEIINFQRNFKAKDDLLYSQLYYCKFSNQYYFLKTIISDKKIFKVPLLAYYNSRLRHENIVKCIGYTKINNQKYIAIEYLPKTLHEYLNDKLELKHRLRLILDIGQGLCLMHEKNTVLMNLSPWSVFVNSEGKAVIFDLDCCSNLNMETQSEMTYKEQDFASPEALNGERGFHCDVYSYGLIAYYILTNGPYSEYIGLDDIQEEFQDIIKLMLRNNPHERPDIMFCYNEFKKLEIIV